MAAKRTTATDDDETTEEPQAQEPSEARKKFEAGEITWRELCEAGG